MSEESKPPRGGLAQRALLVAVTAAVIAFGVYGFPYLKGLFAPPLAFEALDDPPGFRSLGGAGVTAGANPLVGISGGRDPAAEAALASARGDVCQALFGEAGQDAGVVPIASFSDYNCAFCKVLTKELAEIEAASDGGVAVSWHEWPLLGGASEVSAQAALAAKRQGAYVAFHEALMRSRFVPTPEYLTSLAGRIGIDPARMAADMQSAAVADEIAQSRALAGLFGFRGTPALVIGRTVIVGAIDTPTLERVIQREREDGPPPVCATG